MNVNAPLTEKNDSRQTVSPDSSAASSAPPLYSGSEHEYVYSIFRQDPAPVSRMILIAVVLQLLLIPIIGIASYFWNVTITELMGSDFAKSLADALGKWNIICLASPVSLIAILAIPYVPGILVRRAFARVVIPMCRNTCSGKEIARGAMQSLRHMLVCYVLAMIPGVLIFLVPVVFALGMIIKIGCENHAGDPLIIHGSFSVIVWMYILSVPGWLLSEYALAVFPVARLFARLSGAIRPGMFLMLPLIYLARIAFVLNPVCTAERTAFLTVAIILICTALSVGAIAYFNHAAKTGAEKVGA
jgi:hypothetical protein